MTLVVTVRDGCGQATMVRLVSVCLGAVEIIMAKKRSRPPKRDPEVVERFLKKEGLTKVPKGKQVDHKVPLKDGGSDTVRNLQLLTEKQHAAKTAREAEARTKKKGK